MISEFEDPRLTRMTAGTELKDTHQTLHYWVDEHSDYLFRYARKHFSEEVVAEELVQETFVAAVTAISNFKGDASARTWLVGILRHKIVDRIRANTRNKTVSIDDQSEEGYGRYFDEHEHWKPETGPLPWNIDPDKLVEQKQFMAALQSCMEKLPERFRAVFLLREFDGLSRDEISEKLELTSTNIGVILYRSRLALRDCLQTKWLK